MRPSNCSQRELHPTNQTVVTATIHTLAIPSATRYLKDVRRFIVRHAKKAQLSNDAVEALQLAVDEACTNVIEHAYGGSTMHKVDITIVVDPTRFVVRIRDRGQPFDQQSYTAPDVVALTRRGQSGGLGVQVIRKLMDHVEYLSEGPTNEIRLTKYRNR